MDEDSPKFSTAGELVVSCVFNGVGLSLVAGVGTALGQEGAGSVSIETIQYGVLVGVLGIPFGALTGLLVSPLVVGCLSEKPAFRSLVALWIPVYVLAFVGAFVGGPFLAMFLSVFGLVALSLAIRYRMANLPGSWQCPHCAYDLRGHDGAQVQCPECGQRCDRARRS